MSSLQILPLGGSGGVTKNIYAYEYDGQILIVDCGIGFPDRRHIGVDILIPDIDYLLSKKDQIVGMLLTHAHDDHIAALPYVLPDLPAMPIYGSPLTIAFAEDRLKDFQVEADFRPFPDESELSLGSFRIESIKVTHSVPDCRHYVIKTPAGTIYHGSDFKFDLTPVDGVVSEYQKIARVGAEGVLCALTDCLRSEKTSQSLSESLLTETFEREIRGVKGKFIVTSMSSNIHRIQQAVNVAISRGRKVAFIGRSVEQNIRTATRLGMFSIPEKAVIHKKSIMKMPPDRVCVIIAGSQGQPESSLSRAAIGDHSYIQIRPEDKVVFSSEPIPGNEDNVYEAIDNISQIGASIAYSDVDDLLHVSGHASAPEQQLLLELLKPRFAMPIGGTYRHMVKFRELAGQMEIPAERVMIPSSGQSVVFTNGEAHLGDVIQLKDRVVQSGQVSVLTPAEIEERHRMSRYGVITVAYTSDPHQAMVAISLAGMVHEDEQGFVASLREHAQGVLMDKLSAGLKQPALGSELVRDLDEYLYQHHGITPVILATALG